MASVRAVRAATQEQLTEQLTARLNLMLSTGTTTAEVKSGYGLSMEAEIKMLRAIRAAAHHFPGTIHPTALLGHAIDPDVPGFVGITVRQTLPAVMGEFPGITVDAYCEKGAWDVEQCVLLLNRAREMGGQVRIHADQFNDLGMIPAALRLDARSVDHLEATGKEHLLALSQSPKTAGVMLPACGFHMDNRYARGRRFIIDGGALCLATNYNPGSAPCPSMPMIIALAVRHLGLSVAEAITATTVNPARLLGFTDRGVIAPGLRADLLLLRHTDERALGFEFGGNPVERVICGGAWIDAGR
jgi:imidazolonepropionase